MYINIIYIHTLRSRYKNINKKFGGDGKSNNKTDVAGARGFSGSFGTNIGRGPRNLVKSCCVRVVFSLGPRKGVITYVIFPTPYRYIHI